MKDKASVKTHVEDLLREYLGVSELILTEHNEIPIRAGSAILYVHLADEPETPVAHLTSPVLTEVERSAELLEALNDINAAIEVGRLFWEGDTIVASVTLVAETLDLIELAVACDGIGEIADRYDDELQARFGGLKAFNTDG